jgi:hypothetical protein
MEVNRSEKRKTETAEMCFSRLVSGYTLTDHVRNILQIYALKERIEDYRNEWHNYHIRVMVRADNTTNRY